MNKKFAALALATASMFTASAAMAEVGFQFRVPFSVTKAATVGTPSGTSFLLTFDIDPSTTVGILNENMTYTDSKVAARAGTYTVSALRMQKNVSELVYAGLDLGTMNQTANATAGTAYMADIIGGAKLLASKGGKVASYMNVELMYRIANTNHATDTTNLGGVQLSIGAGVNF